MGHDTCVHREYYRQTKNTPQLTKMSKLLMAIECGTEAYKGKSLDEIDFSLESEYGSRSLQLYQKYIFKLTI